MFFYHSRMGDILLFYHVLAILYDIPHAQRWNPHVFPSKRTVNDHFVVMIFGGVRNVADSTAISCCSKPTISKPGVNFWFQKISHPKVRGLKLPGKVLAVLQLLSLQHWIAPRNAVLGRLPSQWIPFFFFAHQVIKGRICQSVLPLVQRQLPLPSDSNIWGRVKTLVPSEPQNSW